MQVNTRLPSGNSVRFSKLISGGGGGLNTPWFAVTIGTPSQEKTGSYRIPKLIRTNGAQRQRPRPHKARFSRSHVLRETSVTFKLVNLRLTTPPARDGLGGTRPNVSDKFSNVANLSEASLSRTSSRTSP